MNNNLQEKGEQLRAAAGQVRGGVSDKLGDLSGSIMFRAILIGALGLCAIAWPATSFGLLLIAIAVLLIVDGLIGIVSVMRANERGAFLGQSILSLAIGALLLFWPGASVKTLFFLLGVWSLLHGIMLLWSLRDLPETDPYRSTQRIVGIILAIIGAVLLIWPGAGIVTLSWMLGLAALVIAGVLFWLSRRMKQLKNRVSGDVA